MTSNLTLSATLISSNRLPNHYAGLIFGQYADRASVRRNNRGRFQSVIVRNFRYPRMYLPDCDKEQEMVILYQV